MADFAAQHCWGVVLRGAAGRDTEGWGLQQGDTAAVGQARQLVVLQRLLNAALGGRLLEADHQGVAVGEKLSRRSWEGEAPQGVAGPLQGVPLFVLGVAVACSLLQTWAQHLSSLLAASESWGPPEGLLQTALLHHTGQQRQQEHFQTQIWWESGLTEQPLGQQHWQVALFWDRLAPAPNPGRESALMHTLADQARLQC